MKSRDLIFIFILHLFLSSDPAKTLTWDQKCVCTNAMLYFQSYILLLKIKFSVKLTQFER